MSLGLLKRSRYCGELGGEVSSNALCHGYYRQGYACCDKAVFDGGGR